MKAWLFLIILAIISDTIAGGVLSVKFWGLRNGGHDRLVRWLALFFGALFLKGVCELCAHASGYRVKPVPTLEHAIFYWSGRAMFAFSIWGLLFYLLKRPKRDTP